jgi:putative transposase
MKSPRLCDFDYSTPGAYFVTICLNGGDCRFGEVDGDRVVLNDAGLMVADWWNELAHKYRRLRLDEFIVMPNHLHGIVVITDGLDQLSGRGDPMWSPSPPPNLSGMIDWYKTMTTNSYIKGVKARGWPRYDRHLWQRSFYDRVITRERTLELMRRYIQLNPLRWPQDREHPWLREMRARAAGESTT